MAATHTPAGTEAPSGTLTFLFTDLAGSTRLWERHPDAMKDALRRHDAILREAIEGSGGQVVKTTGDGMMAVFGSASDGVAAGLAAQIALAQEAWGETGPLRVRMGLHSGEADRRADDYFGPTLNRTARLMAAGHGGQVLLSASAAALSADRLPPGTSLRDLGEHRLKDLGRPERVYQLEHADLGATFPPLVAAGVGPSALPSSGGSFVGRAEELATIGRRLADDAVRLVTLTGPGGTGKTSLAIHAAAAQAERFTDGIHFVDLAACRDEDALVVALGRAIGIGESVERSMLDELKAHLRDRRVLLVLDNFEQVAGGAVVASDLLAACPLVTMLVTSREPLHVRAEYVVAVPPLALPSGDPRRWTAAELSRYEAVQLFVERAQAVRSEFVLTDDNAAAIAEICLRLDGLPLAIELAAARLRLFSPDALRDRLGSRLELLRSATRDLPARQQTLSATIDWSYQLLDEGERHLFELLSVFADADVAAVEVVWADAADGWAPDSSTGPAAPSVDPIDGLASLLDKSLIRQVDANSGEPRLVMLETIREYAAERLAARLAWREPGLRAHATYYAELAASHRHDLVGAGRDQALALMAVEAGNMRSAWRYWTAAGDLDQLDKLADSLLILNDARSWYGDTVSLTTDLLGVLAAAESGPERVSQEISLRMTLARALMASRGYTPEVEDAYTRARELFESRDAGPEGGREARQHFAVLRALASLYLLQTDFEQALALGRQILELADRTNDPDMRIDGQLVVGSSLVFIGEIKPGVELLEGTIASFGSRPGRAHHRFGNHPRVACLTTSALAHWLLGFPDTGLARANAAITLSSELGHPFTAAFARFHAGLIHMFRREPEAALERALAVLEIADEHDLQIWTAVGTCLLGASRAGVGRTDEGLADIRRGLDMYRGMRTPPVFWPMLLFLDGVANLVAGRGEAGLASVEPAIAMMEGGPRSALVPEFWILKGDLLGLDPAQGAQDRGRWYRQALDQAGALETRMSRLRAASRLLSLANGDGDRPAAAVELASVLDTFTEGLETADLREARELLDAAPSG